MGSRTLPGNRLPHSKPEARVTVTPGSMSPAVPWGFRDSGRAIPHECADSLVPVRCGRKLKHLPKLVIFLEHSRFAGLQNTSVKTPPRLASHLVTVLDLSGECQRKRQRNTRQNSVCLHAGRGVIRGRIGRFAEGCADLVEAMGARQKRGGSGRICGPICGQRFLRYNRAFSDRETVWPITTYENGLLRLKAPAN
jgi:hypothetical protein